MNAWGGGPRLPSGLDQFDKRQEPQVEPIDDLSRFVMGRIYGAEAEPRIDGVLQAYNDTHGPWVHRYAGYIRADMVVFRNIVQLYVEAQADEDSDPYATSADYQKGARNYLEAAMLVLANRWSKHPDFREEWRL